MFSSAAKAVSQAQHDERKGVKRFCQVTSGRSVKGEADYRMKYS